MKKKFGQHWKQRLTLYMVCTSCFAAILVATEPAPEGGDAGLKLKEAELARQAAEQRCAELSLALVRTERDLEKQRQQYAELYLKAQRQQEVLNHLQLRAATLLNDRDGADSEYVLEKALTRLRDRMADYGRLYEKIRDFGQYQQTVLETVNASAALKHDAAEKMADLIRFCDRLESIPPIVAGRGGEKPGPQACRILTVNPDLGIAVLDTGENAGVRESSEWRVLEAGKTVARLRVIEVRPGFSAAVAVEGRLERLNPGQQALNGE